MGICWGAPDYPNPSFTGHPRPGGPVLTLSTSSSSEDGLSRTLGGTPNESIPNGFVASTSNIRKVVLKVDLHDVKARQKAMKAVFGLSGVDSLTVDMREQKMTVIGAVDPVAVVTKLKKKWHPEILTVGPAKEPEKKEEPKKEGAKKADDKKKEDQQIAELVKAYGAYYPNLARYYHVVSMEEDPNACVIC